VVVAGIIRKRIWLRAVPLESEYWSKLSDDVIEAVITVNA
jgi:hypothetical protein